MVNADTSSVIATLTFNGILGAALMIVFELFRSYQPDIYAPRTRKAGGEILPKPGGFPFSWVYSVWTVDDDEFIRTAGLDAYVYLRYLKMCFRLFAICAFFALVVLCPIYATANLSTDDDTVEGITLFSMANIPQDSDKLWAPLVFAYFFTFLFLYFLFKEYENFTRARAIFFQGGDKEMPAQMTYSVQVENIPPQFRTSPKLKALFESLFPQEVMFSYVSVSLTQLEKAVEERKKLLAKLEQSIAEFEASGLKTRPTLSLLKGIIVPAGGDESVDAIDYLYDQISIVSEEIRSLQEDALFAEEGRRDTDLSMNPLSPKDHDSQSVVSSITNGSAVSAAAGQSDSYQLGSVSIKRLDKHVMSFISDNITSRMISATGFVTFRSRRAQAVAAQIPALSKDFPQLKAIPAPAHKDIIWQNMSASTEHTESVSFFTSMMYYAGLIFWSAILAFIAAISNLSNLEKYFPALKSLDETTYAILQGILPVLIMLAFLTLLPIAMAFVSQYIERRKTFSAVQQEVFKWYFMYQLANVYLLLLTGSAFNSLGDMIDDPESILNYISAALPTSSVFFINFIITQIFAGIPLIYLRIGPMLYFNFIRYTNNEKKLTRRTLFEGPLADATIEYGTTLPDALYVLCITLLYWVISPMVLVAAVLFFGGSYIAYKYQYLYVVVRKSESGGQYWYGLYNYSMMGLLFSTATIMTYMSIKEAIEQAPLLLPLPFIIIFAWRYTEGRFKALSENVPYSIAVAEDTDPSAHAKTKTFTEDYLKQPALIAPKTVFPYPYRIGGMPLLDENGRVSSVYIEDLPEGVCGDDPTRSYIPPAYQEVR